MNNSSLTSFFDPHNIAVMGASNNPLKAGYVITNNLLKIKYPKKIFPINRKEDNILGLPAYNTLSEIEDSIEMLILITPSSVIEPVMQDLEKRMQEKGDIKAIVCAAAGYAELDTPEGKHRQKVLTDTAKKYNIRVIGPNCIGVVDNEKRVDTTFVETLTPEENRGIAGGISFISQSGALAASVLMRGASLLSPMKFNKFVSIGNMSDVDFIELLEHFEDDESTRVIGMYMEGYPEGRKLIDTMGCIASKKPIVVLKVGRSEKGATAASSHTGSLAGEDKIYDSAFRQYGIIRVNSIDEMIDTLRAFDQLSLPQGNKFFLTSQAGGPGIFCMDTMSNENIFETPMISEETKKKLKELLPPMANVCSPEGYNDISASANVEQHVEGIRILFNGPEVEGGFLISVLTPFIPQDELGDEIVKLCNDNKNKPLFVVIMSGNVVDKARTIVEEAGIPTFETPDRAVKAAANLIRYSEFKKLNK
ncbi:MAG: CoA-binding protein [Clostridiales bacterium]|nr:CoA-binding protein [Clostridiales bacterium]MCF8022035.1 CoA-binding protein [Clostridiales bacterium]